MDGHDPKCATFRALPKRSLKRAKDGNKTRRKSDGRLIEGRMTTNWKQALAQLAAAYPERMEPYL